MSQSGILDDSGATPVGPGRFPITPFVVGPSGQAGYQTVQSALNAANAAGGGIVYVQPGNYTENLTLYGNTAIVGTPGNSDAGTSGNTVTLTGTHTPPLTGSFEFSNLNFVSATDVLSSNGAGSAAIVLLNVLMNITNGYMFNLPNWTGTLVTYNVGDISTNNGMVNNSAGSTCFFVSATHGAGTGQTMNTSGPVILQEIDFNCPWNAGTGTSIACDYTIFTQNVTCSGTSSGNFSHCKFLSGSTQPLTISTSGAIDLENSIINTSNATAIGGAGSGTVSFAGTSFTNNSTIAPTVTVASNSIFLAGQVGAGGDIGGKAGYTSITRTNSTTIGAGTGTVKMTSGNNADNAVWIKIYVGTIPYWIPAWATNAP